MPAPDPATLALLAEVRSKFASGLPAKVSELRAHVEAAAWDEARRAAHKLRGSAGTYGFVELSAAAAGIEETLLACNLAPDEEARSRIDARLREAHSAADRASRSDA